MGKQTKDFGLCIPVMAWDKLCEKKWEERFKHPSLSNAGIVQKKTKNLKVIEAAYQNLLGITKLLKISKYFNINMQTKKHVMVP